MLCKILMQNTFREGKQMNKLSLDRFVAAMQKELSGTLPGTLAQMEMVPATRRSDASKHSATEARRQSAVLVLFYKRGWKTCFPLVKRVIYNGVHSGQISLPGGQYEETDRDFSMTALRETEEEIGVETGKIKLLGELSPIYIPPSNFDVHPFVGYVSEEPEFHIDPVEIDSLLEIELDTFMDPACKTEKMIHHRTGVEVTVPCFYLQDEIVWGATAMILNELREVVYKIWHLH